MKLTAVDERFDVAVCGGGISGCMAASAASREGCRTILIERFSDLGGMATLGLVQPISTWGINGKYIIGGTGAEILKALHSRSKNAATSFNLYGVVCDSEYLKRELEEIALKYKVALLYNTYFREAIKQREDEIEKLSVFSKNGDFAIKAKVYIDATGDADVAASAGIPYETGSQGITVMMTVSGIDSTKLPARKKIDEIWSEKRGSLKPLAVFFHPRGDIAYINAAEVQNHDPLNPVDLTDATIECRRQLWEIHEILKSNVPGFKNSFISQTASSLGVRESRRIQGEYVLSEEDVLTGRNSGDVVARACSPIDIHGIENNGYGDYRGLKKSYAIPYRSLVSGRISNLIAAGRCVSADRAAFSSLRRMAPGFAIGEAAGIAAAIAAKENTHVRDIPVKLLQSKLLGYGAILEPEAA